MTRRRGYSLVECLVAIALIAATFTAVAVATSGMYRACQRVGQESAVELELARLAAQLRADAHQAASVKLEVPADSSATPSTLSLVEDGGRSIDYKLRGGQVERVVRQRDTVGHRDGYRLPGTFAARWQVERDRPLALVSLILDPGPLGTSGTLGFEAFRVDAAVGLLRPARAAEEP